MPEVAASRAISKGPRGIEDQRLRCNKMLGRCWKGIALRSYILYIGNCQDWAN